MLLYSSVLHLLVGRFLCGLGIGIASVIVPTYIGEISPKEKRGVLGTLPQVAICAGILGALLIGIPINTNTNKITANNGMNSVGIGCGRGRDSYGF